MYIGTLGNARLHIWTECSDQRGSKKDWKTNETYLYWNRHRREALCRGSGCEESSVQMGNVMSWKLFPYAHKGLQAGGLKYATLELVH